MNTDQVQSATEIYTFADVDLSAAPISLKTDPKQVQVCLLTLFSKNCTLVHYSKLSLEW